MCHCLSLAHWTHWSLCPSNCFVLNRPASVRTTAGNGQNLSMCYSITSVLWPTSQLHSSLMVLILPWCLDSVSACVEGCVLVGLCHRCASAFAPSPVWFFLHGFVHSLTPCVKVAVGRYVGKEQSTPCSSRMITFIRPSQPSTSLSVRWLQLPPALEIL